MARRLIKIFPDAESLSHAAAALFTEYLTLAVRQNEAAYAVLSGGSTPLLLFEKLAQLPYRTAIPWDGVHFFWADERCVLPEDAQSNYGQAKRTLLDSAGVPTGNIHRMCGECEPEIAAADYAEQLSKFGQAGRAWPMFGLALLGLGEDGHTASLFPGPASSSERLQPVAAVYADYQNRPARRVTMTPLVLNDAKTVIFLVSGLAKAEIAARILEGPLDPDLLPAQRIQPNHGSVIWLLDRAAAGRLRNI